MKYQIILSRAAAILLQGLPFFTFPVFLSVLTGTPPLWLGWVIAILPWLLLLGVTKRLTYRTPFDIPILILTAGILLGLFLSPDRQLSLSFLNTYLACVLFYYGIVNNSQARAGYWVFITVILSLIFLFLSAEVFASGTVRDLTFNSWAIKLASTLPWSLSLTPHFNALGAAFAVVIPLLVAMVIFQKRLWVRCSAGILAVIFGGILILSASGGGWIAAMAGIFLVLLFCSPRVMQGALLASGVLWATFPLWHNASWLGAIFYPEALPGRIERWQATLAALNDSPLTGFGLGGWWSKLTTFSMEDGPHNAYILLYSDAGALGAIALIVAFVITARLFWRIIHADKNSPYYSIALGIIASIIAGGIHALVDSNLDVLIPMNNKYLYFAIPFLWLWAALLVVADHHLRGNGQSNHLQDVRRQPTTF